MATITVKAAEGLVARDPVRMDLIEPEGREVELTPFWIRRLRDGDVVEVKPTPAADAKPAAKA